MGGENLIKGTDWVGDISRLSYDDTKSYVMLLKEKGVAVLDDEINFLQTAHIALLRKLFKTFIGDGSPDTGFQIVGTGATNNFTIKAGKLIVDGWLQSLASDTSYSGQPVSQSALTTPGSDRTDHAYIDMWLEEIDDTEDSAILDPTLNYRTSCRLKLMWAIKVAEGGSTPASGVGAQNKYHWYYQVATLNRLAGNAAITAEMVTDNRTVSHSSRTDNPHTVTAAQAGAEPVNANIQQHIARIDNPHAVTAVQAGAIPATEKGAASGVAPLDSNSKVPTANLPDAILGALIYQGIWNANTNTPAIPAASSSNRGYYYKVNVAGSTNIDGISDWQIGDWIVSNGTTWDKVDNSEIVTSVAGKIGAVTLEKADVGLANVDNTADANKSVSHAVTAGGAVTLGGLFASGFIQVDGNVTQANMGTLVGAGVTVLHKHADVRMLPTPVVLMNISNTITQGDNTYSENITLSSADFEGNTPSFMILDIAGLLEGPRYLFCFYAYINSDTIDNILCTSSVDNTDHGTTAITRVKSQVTRPYVSSFSINLRSYMVYDNSLTSSAFKVRLIGYQI